LDKLSKAANESQYCVKFYATYQSYQDCNICIWSQKNARHMCWHKDGTHANPHVMVHPSDVEAWKNFSLVFPEFALEPRNVRVVVATYGFNPFVFGAPYSW
jgi:hypothetical protein